MNEKNQKILLNVKGINRGILYSFGFFFIFINVVSIIFICNVFKNYKTLELFMYYISIIGGGFLYGTLPILIFTVLIAVPSTWFLIKIDNANKMNLALIGTIISVISSFLLNKETYAILLIGAVGFCWGWFFMKGYQKGNQS